MGMKTPTVPGTLEERFDESAIGKAVSSRQLATLVDIYGLETVATWLGNLAAIQGKKITLTGA
jgi:hypothetical protein